MSLCTILSWSITLNCIAGILAAGCVSTSLSVEEKLKLNANYNDHNSDNLVDFNDIAYDLEQNYDTDKDGEVTEGEFITRWTCAFGDTDFFARFSFAEIGQGRAVIRKQYFNSPPLVAGIPKDSFISLNRQRYNEFQRYSCINRQLSVPQKIDLIAKDNDHDNNSIVDATDFEYDFSNRYDYNKDGNITVAEWVERWVCAYGDTVAFALYVWNQVGQGTQSVQSNSFNFPPFDTGIPIAAFRQTQEKRYEAFAKQQPVGR